MDNILYEALTKYYHALEYNVYMENVPTQELLVLGFYRDFIYRDYRGLLSKENYSLIGKALDCLFGNSCLIPYPDYLKMGKLHLGDMTEMAQRVKTLEDTDVVKLIHAVNGVSDEDSDIMIVTDEE